ncbi:hypothetical protein ACIBCR_15145 [Micromonospora echinospora]|uniref:hypothetical protein n=1 Tax=Micromonospora echinospora TaxID=1877 RepID=UPI0037B46DC5
MESAAYYNWGRWVADCAVEMCADAREVTVGQVEAACRFGHPFRVVWPPQDLAAQVVAVLEERVEQHRSWFPSGHPLAVATGQPHGQTVEELREETRWLQEQAAQQPIVPPGLDQVLAGFGLALAEDGTTLRRL